MGGSTVTPRTDAPGEPETAEWVWTVRHARKRLGVVLGLLRAYYGNRPRTTRRAPRGPVRVFRGGGLTATRECRSAFRDWSNRLHYPGRYLGFCLARDASPGNGSAPRSTRAPAKSARRSHWRRVQWRRDREARPHLGIADVEAKVGPVAPE